MDEAVAAKAELEGTPPEDQTGTKSSLKHGSVILPLLHKHPDSSLQTSHPSLAGTDGTNSSVPKEKDQSEECPVCCEPFQTHGDHVAAVLHCNHTVCQRCVLAVQRMAPDPSRLRCPLCRQTTPLPQWDILSLQEEIYSSGVYTFELGRGDMGPDLRPWYRYKLMRIHSLYLYITALVLLLLMLGYLLSRDKS